jgi:hypothetical protein
VKGLLEGGWELFVQFWFNRASNSVILADCSSIVDNADNRHGNQFYEFAYKFVIRNTFINILAISVNHFRFY